MNHLKAICAGSVLLGLVLGSATTAAQQQQQFPSQRDQPQDCRDINWNDEMRRNHSALIDACKEVVTAGDRTWARFEARFVRVEQDGEVIFSVRDQRDRSIEEVRLRPNPNQVAYINDRPTPFRQLRSSDTVNLYVPEGGYGFATEPGGELASVERDREATADRDRQDRDTGTQVAQRDQQRDQQRGQRSDQLPRTASALPWFALGGILSLLGGLSLALRRKV